ncbi:MAG: hypothetical protein IJ515_03770 [Clostridia bacterium]|nr:hypothetical protein [Clostridia bacterium]
MAWDESKHPRKKENGRFDKKDGSSSSAYTDGVNARIAEAKRLGIPVPLNADGSVDDLRLQEDISKAKQFRTFTDQKSVDEFFLYDNDKRGLLAKRNSLHGKWEKRLTPQQRYTISDYIGDGYSNINSYLRGYDNGVKYDVDFVKQQIADLDIAIDDYTLKEPITTYRSIDSEAFWEHLDNIESLVGTEYTDPAFMSTSPSLDSTALNKDVIMTIRLPAGKGIGAYINEYNGLGEIEFLLARGSKFKITKATKDKKIYRIEMELIK